MKRFFFPFLLLFILIFSACQEKLDVAKEKEAIIAALKGESDAYLAMDSTKWMSYWVQDDLTLRVDVSEESYNIMGWKQMYETMKANMQNDTVLADYKDMKFTKSDYVIKVHPDCAWAFFNEKFTATYKGEPIETEDTQVRILEKVDGQWKIAFMGSIDVTSYKEEAAEEAQETAED
jgi:ketosteroid isomerase-like protein